jgi:hypothetical protein
VLIARVVTSCAACFIQLLRYQLHRQQLGPLILHHQLHACCCSQHLAESHTTEYCLIFHHSQVPSQKIPAGTSVPAKRCDVSPCSCYSLVRLTQQGCGFLSILVDRAHGVNDEFYLQAPSSTLACKQHMHDKQRTTSCLCPKMLPAVQPKTQSTACATSHYHPHHPFPKP